MAEKVLTVIGAGLAGCEAAYQAAKLGVHVVLREMKPEKRTPAHATDNFAELVCSNSLRADGLRNAVGLLKEELSRMGSLIMEAAYVSRVPAGGALAVDRSVFAEYITDKIKTHPDIEIVTGEALTFPTDSPVVVASGPLTSDGLSSYIQSVTGAEYLHFHDAAAPIVSADSVDMSVAYLASRYGKGDADYINCPMTKEQYDDFYEALVSAPTANLHGEDAELTVFEGCMPVEIMAGRGRETLLYGPLKPVGLPDPNTGKLPHAVVQLRIDNASKTMYNIVGFQTHLTFEAQKRVFSMIPGLENAEFLRYGVMHRNTYLYSPGLLDSTYTMRTNGNVRFAGQMTGVEGYVESTASGLVAGLSAACEILGRKLPLFPPETAIGALAAYISNPAIGYKDFQPMNINFGIISPLETYVKAKKRDRYELVSKRALGKIDAVAEEMKINK